jgi:riboflavin kinase/FMN adenylyltransferase
VGYNLLAEGEAFDWDAGRGSGGTTSGSGVIAIPALSKADNTSGTTSEIAIANLVPQPGFTDFAVLLFDQNGLVDYVCPATFLGPLPGMPFTREFAAIPAAAFVEDLLVRKIGLKAIVVGEDYAFGKNRAGDIGLLKELATRFGYEVLVTSMIRTVKGMSERISSTAIREMVLEGKVEPACKMLGRHFQVRGIVVSGRDRGGRLLGIPTANLKLEDELCPKTGIYAVTAELAGGLHHGVANIGYSPTFEDRQFTVEVHILDFHGDIYGQKMRVNFVKRLRDEMKFAGIDALKRQIELDIDCARRVLEN